MGRDGQNFGYWAVMSGSHGFFKHEEGIQQGLLAIKMQTAGRAHQFVDLFPYLQPLIKRLRRGHALHGWQFALDHFAVSPPMVMVIKWPMR